MNKFVKTVKTSNIYVEFLKSLNGLLQLTPRELMVLAKIIEFNPTATNSSMYVNVVSLPVRRRLIKELRVNKSNLSTHIGKFLKQRILYKDFDTGSIYLNRAIVPIIDNNTVTIQMTINLNDEKNN